MCHNCSAYVKTMGGYHIVTKHNVWIPWSVIDEQHYNSLESPDQYKNKIIHGCCLITWYRNWAGELNMFCKLYLKHFWQEKYTKIRLWRLTEIVHIIKNEFSKKITFQWQATIKTIKVE